MAATTSDARSYSEDVAQVTTDSDDNH
jgi:hypothetical protein